MSSDNIPAMETSQFSLNIGQSSSQHQGQGSSTLPHFQGPSTSHHDDPNEIQDEDANDQGAPQPSHWSRQTREWLTTTSMPGGPEDPSVLCAFKAHKASKIWEDPNFVRVLDPQTRSKSIRRWPLNSFLPGLSLDLVNTSGLAEIGGMMFHSNNMALITAFVERWHPETNTFHMPFGEMTITFHDIQAILGLNINGSPIIVPEGADQTDQALKSACGNNGEKPTVYYFETIKGQCTNPNTNLSDESIARGYLWYTMGATLFVDRTRDVVPIRYLKVLGDLIGTVPNYAWGAAALAYLYHQLGQASRRETTQILGCLTLLECWIYKYFAELNKRGEANFYNEETPCALKWNKLHRFDSSTYARDVVHYRKLLDNYPSTHINWTPFGLPSTILPASLFHGCVNFMEYAEGYMPKKVARQFGRIQGIPPAPLGFDRNLSRLGPNARGYKKVYGLQVAYWYEMEHHYYPLGHLGHEAVIQNQTTPEYME